MSFLFRLREFALKKHRKAKITWLGLDAAGKTTLIHRIVQGEFMEETKRTLGLNVDKIIVEADKTLELISWDLGGQLYFRQSLWKSYMENTNGIIFVVDAADSSRFLEAKKEIHTYVFSQDLLEETPILVLANKQDLPKAVDSGTLVRSLELENILHKKFVVFPVSAKTAYNLKEAFDWLYEEILAQL